MTSSGRTHSPDVVGCRLPASVSSSHKSKMKALNAIGDTRPAVAHCCHLCRPPVDKRGSELSPSKFTAVSVRHCSIGGGILLGHRRGINFYFCTLHSVRSDIVTAAWRSRPMDWSVWTGDRHAGQRLEYALELDGKGCPDIRILDLSENGRAYSLTDFPRFFMDTRK